jgi:formiminotetrahydrofolate cyclodeaminase
MTEMSCMKFTALLASRAPVPGGGGAAALVGAVGIALGNMVGSLTLGKKAYAGVEGDIIALNGKAETLRRKLLALVEADAAAFEPLARAYGIPKDAEGRDGIMEAALDTATAVPMEIMRGVCEALETVEQYAAKGSALAVSDAGCAAAVCGAALRSAALNVFINTKSMKDREKAGRIEAEADAMLEKYGALADGIYDGVMRRLRN